MFLIKAFKHGILVPRIFDFLKDKLYKYILLFIILVFISVFPLSYTIVKQQGIRLNFVKQTFISEEPMWDLPVQYAIMSNQFKVVDGDLNHKEIITYGDIHFVFNGTIEDAVKNQKTIIFTTKELIYSDQNGATLYSGGYQGFPTESVFREMNEPKGSLERKDMFIAFGNAIETSFGKYIVLYALLIHIFQSLVINIGYVLLLSLIVQLFRFTYAKFMTYQEVIKMIILSMILPSVIAFIIGFISLGFAPVAFQVSMGLVVMINMLVFAKKKYS